MNEPISDRDAIWDAFLLRWPLEKLPEITVEEYSKAGDKDCFTYWLESRTEGLGSIWGGSAFKFGVFGRKDQTAKTGEGVIYGTEYAWGTKYGTTLEEAFSNVRGQIVAVAKAAREGDLQTVEAADLGTVTKWKIAFLYQDRRNPKIINIFKLDHLQALGSPGQKLPASELHPKLAAARGNKHVLAYADELWAKIEEAEASELSTASALKYLQESGQFSPIKPPTEKMAGFRVASGRELALARDNKRPTIYLSPGPWVQQVSDLLSAVVTYGPNAGRSSNLAANAPALGAGNPIVKVTLATQAALTALCNAYESADGSEDSEGAPPQRQAPAFTGEEIPLNQILYGPPGTGKTYRTVEEALRILDAAFLRANLNDRASQKRRYDELVRSRAIRFVTFHQSFSYEDFVEGIRAVADDLDGTAKEGSMPRFQVEDGIFKLTCDSADVHVKKQVGGPIELKGRTIWKMSLGNSETEAEIYEECIEKGYALLGYGSQIDFSGVTSAADVLARFQASGQSLKESDYAVKAVATFLLSVKTNDLLIVTDGNFKFRAIGEVVGGYEHAPRPDWEGYAQRRSVRWLRVYEPSLPFDRIMDKQFVQRTLYMLKDGSLDRTKLADLLKEDLPTATNAQAGAATSSSPKVLIIDEINRGNVSRIFGELITLIEPSKRRGMPEALEVVLPYSKKAFSVPANIHLIGTMNTADRSLTGIDIALRRRFSFVEVPPQPELLNGVVVEDIGIDDLLRTINARIEALLDRDHRIGHSYFLPLKKDDSLTLLASIFRRQVVPLLQEYFFEDWGRIRLVLNDHQKKDPQHCFLRPAGHSAEALFGPGDNFPVLADRWTVNEDAFKFADSYRGILRK
jgi:5-methylcytosine-specific restriction protein B